METLARKKRAARTGLLVLFALFSFYQIVVASDGRYPSDEARIVWALCVSLLLAWWVLADGRLRGLSFPFEFGAFVFFFWPLVIFWYLITTRGAATGIVLAVSIVLFFFLPYWVGDLVYAFFGSQGSQTA